MGVIFHTAVIHQNNTIINIKEVQITGVAVPLVT